MLHTATPHLCLSAGQLGLAVLFGCSVLVLVKGGPAERAAMLLLAGAWVGAFAAQAVTGEIAPSVLFLFTDLALAVGFLALAIRYASVWLGGAMMLEGALFFIHSAHLSDDSQLSYGYLLAMNILSYCVLACVVGGACASWRRRVRLRRLNAAEPPLEEASGPVTAP